MLDLPVLVVGLLAVAVSNYDVKAESRGWGRGLLGNGVTIGSDHYSVGQARKQVDGEWVECVQLTIRRQFFGDKAKQTVESYLLPMDDLRRIEFTTSLLS